MKHSPNHRPHLVVARRGYTLLEFTVAMVVLGIALAGLFPLTAMQSRTVESLELRYTQAGQGGCGWFKPVFRPNVTAIISQDDRENYKASGADSAWYLVPSSDPWARKLGAPATLSQTPSPSTSAVTLIDDGDVGFTAIGSKWTPEANNQAFGGDNYQCKKRNNPNDCATWTFSNVATGWYDVMATWSPSSGLATKAQYEIDDGKNDPSPFFPGPVDQTQAPNGPIYQGTSPVSRPWQLLAHKYFKSSDNQVKVVLSADASKGVVADAVRIVPVATVLSLSKSFNSEAVTVRAKIERTP